MLGVLYAALGAFTFALNNATMRRGVVTGSVLQGMALTVPIGGISFLLMTIAFGELDQLLVFPIAALTWLAAQGIVHFVIGRYCNYKSNQLMGVNLAAPVIQLQVPFAMMLAVVMLHEKFTVLQAIGSALMLGGAFTTQANASNSKNRASTPRATAATTSIAPAEPHAKHKPTFRPQVFSGYIFAFAAAACYGSSPLMARAAFLRAPGASTVAGGCLAYAAATLVFSLALLKPGACQDIKDVKLENLRWFLCRGRTGRYLSGLGLRFACNSATDGSYADSPALIGLPPVSVAIDQPRPRGDEQRSLNWRVHGGAWFDPGFGPDR